MYIDSKPNYGTKVSNLFKEYKLVHIGDVTRYNNDLFRKIEKELTLQGYICFCPVIYDPAVWEPNQEMLDKMCFEKLMVCDIFVIATPWRVGESTSLKVKQCIGLDIPVKVYNFETRELEDYNPHISYAYNKYGCI